MSSLLEEAELLLTRGGAFPESRRGACWLARNALEEAVRRHLELRGYAVGSATMRSLLACLESLGLTGPDVAASAKFAWIGLSRASHHPAYELAPTVSEVRHVIALVDEVTASVPEPG